MRSVTQSILEETLKMNEKRSKEEIEQLSNRFWEIYSEQVEENPHRFETRAYHAYVALKKI